MKQPAARYFRVADPDSEASGQGHRAPCPPADRCGHELAVTSQSLHGYIYLQSENCNSRKRAGQVVRSCFVTLRLGSTEEKPQTPRTSLRSPLLNRSKSEGRSAFQTALEPTANIEEVM